MDEKREKFLLELSHKRLSTGGMIGLENFIKSHDGTREDKEYLSKLMGILSLRNGCAATRTYSLLEYSSLKNIINDTHFMANKISPDNGGRYLKLKLEEFFYGF